MMKSNVFSVFSVFVVAFLLCLTSFADSRVDLSRELYPEENLQGVITSWCIAKPSTDAALLYQNIQYICHQAGVDCTAIRPGGSCFSPNDVVSQASYAMNLYYRSAGKNPWNCDFRGTALIVTEDPTFGSCIYPV